FKLNSTDERVKDFVQSFKIKYAEDPDVWAAQGYDTLKILAHAIERAVSTASYDIAASLNQIRDWEGVTGKLSFSETGEIQGKTISKKIVRNGKFQFLEE
ncbi:MAG: ABC transporter substrate-binding protein, partial [Clostridiaceae bacterium]|nr:ABC transporter substrate-binding protein [Clostridiaceae bacterium]